MLKNILKQYKDGATLHPLSLEPQAFNQGYAVSITDNAIQGISEKSEAEIKKLLETINTIAKALNLQEYFIGYWMDEKTGIGYLDISLHVNNKKTAIEIGKLHNQKAIFSFKNYQSLYI